MKLLNQYVFEALAAVTLSSVIDYSSSAWFMRSIWLTLFIWCIVLLMKLQGTQRMI
jgi:hypothetical protein